MTRWNSLIDNQTIKARYFITVVVNVAKTVFSFFGGVVIARTLGPVEYGNYSFLLGSFTSFIGLVNMGTSSAFYTFISQRKRNLEFYRRYSLWIIIQFIIILLLISVIFPNSWRNAIWLGHTKEVILIAFFSSFMMNSAWHAITQAGESIRATIIVQLYNVTLLGSYLVTVLTIAFLFKMTTINLFISGGILYLLFSVALGNRLKDNLIADEGAKKLSSLINEFKVYCAPLAISSVVGFIYSFADLWLLQKYGGAVQQGFYSIGSRFSNICLLATVSILNIFWKEITAANSQRDINRLRRIYTMVSRGIYFFNATLVCFLIPFSKEIMSAFLGTQYESGWLCLSIMFLYPLTQSLGQINGSYLLATAKTRLYSLVIIIMSVISIVVTYFLLAPRSNQIPGLFLGSVGLAIKMVVLGMITVNILTYFISKASGWKFDISYQFKSLGILLTASFLIKLLLNKIFFILNFYFATKVLLIISLPLYILAVGLIVYLFPQLSGLERKHLNEARVFLYNFLK